MDESSNLMTAGQGRRAWENGFRMTERTKGSKGEGWFLFAFRHVPTERPPFYVSHPRGFYAAQPYATGSRRGSTSRISTGCLTHDRVHATSVIIQSTKSCQVRRVQVKGIIILHSRRSPNRTDKQFESSDPNNPLSQHLNARPPFHRFRHS
jgi:hypothetical protein